MRISDWSSDVCSSDLLLAEVKAAGFFGVKDSITEEEGTARVRQGHLGAIGTPADDLDGVVVLVVEHGIDAGMTPDAGDFLDGGLGNKLLRPHVLHSHSCVALLRRRGDRRWWWGGGPVALHRTVKHSVSKERVR